MSGYECQDGGFDPSSNPVEEKEKAKEKKAESKKEEEEKPQKIKKKKKKKKRSRKKPRILEGPHQQEPNQVTCPSPDGYCDTGLADLIINQIGVEQQNIVTDPLLNGWQQRAERQRGDRRVPQLVRGRPRRAASPPTPKLMPALCSTSHSTVATTTSTMPSTLAALNLPYPGIPCLPGIRLEPEFTAPNLVNAGEIVGFDGMESDITLNVGTAYTGKNAQKDVCHLHVELRRRHSGSHRLRPGRAHAELPRNFALRRAVAGSVRREHIPFLSIWRRIQRDAHRDRHRWQQRKREQGNHRRRPAAPAPPAPPAAPRRPPAGGGSAAAGAAAGSSGSTSPGPHHQARDPRPGGQRRLSCRSRCGAS